MTPNRRFDRKLREVVQATRSSVPEARRLDRLLGEFRALHAQLSFLQRVIGWFAHAHRIPGPAIALACMLLVAQGIALVQLLPQREEAELYRGLSVPCEDQPQIRIVFRPDAPQAEIVMLLRKVEASVTAGPSETGQIWVRIPKGRALPEAVKQLQASALVDEAVVVPPDRSGCPR